MPATPSIPMPERLARRPQFRGYPVPYTTLIRPDGTPDFKVTDEPKRGRCWRDNLCALCGEPLEYWIAFIGGEQLVELREFYDPAMHEACARYAARTCPFLAHTDAAYATTSYAPGEVAATHYAASADRPKRMGLYITRGYEPVTRQIAPTETVTMLRADPAYVVEWDAMPETA